ncbi:MAG: hypothetical protein ACRC5M_06250, partial [Anaeroplasmataceae bacterium]
MNKIEFKFDVNEINKLVKDVQKNMNLGNFTVNEDNVNLLFICELENQNCIKCKSINDCKNSNIGYKRVPINQNGTIFEKAVACDYKKSANRTSHSKSLIKSFYASSSILNNTVNELYKETDTQKKCHDYYNKLEKNLKSNKKIEKGLYLYGQ